MSVSAPTMNGREGKPKFQAVSTEGLTAGQLDELGKFAKFADLPVEMRDKIWEEYVLQYKRDLIPRDVHVKIVLEALRKTSSRFSKLMSKLKSISKGSKYDNNSDNDDSSPKFSIAVKYAPHSNAPPTPYSVSSRSRTLAFKYLPHKAVFPLPLHGPANNDNNTITKIIPVSFFSNDTLTITFPCASEMVLEFLFYCLCPSINRHASIPAELFPTGWRLVENPSPAVIALAGRNVEERMLKGAGAVVYKRNWLKGGKKEGRSILTFRLCQDDEGLEVNVGQALGGDSKGWKVKHRLRGVPIGYWDVHWLRLMECFETYGDSVYDSDFVLSEDGTVFRVFIS